MTLRKALKVRSAIAAASVAALLVAQPAQGQSMPAPPAPFEVVGGVGARTVELAPCVKTAPQRSGGLDPPACRRPGSNDLVGTLSLAVANHSDQAVQLSIKYMQNGSGSEVAVLSDPPVTLVGPARTSPEVKEGAQRVFAIRFDVRRGTDPSRVSGMLDLRFTGGPTAGELNVPVTLKAKPLTDIRFEPSSIAIDRAWPGDPGPHRVDLWGSGLKALFDVGAPKAVEIRLEGPGGRTVLVALKDIKSAESPLHATANVALMDHPEPGRYAGAIPLSPMQGQAPHLDVVVHSRRAWWFALLLVLAGLLVGGFAPRIAALRRRRRLLRHALTDAIDNYKIQTIACGQQPTAWRLSDVVRPSTVDSMRASIGSARNDADLDEDTRRVLDVVARVQRWLRLEPAARRLRRLVDLPPPGDLVRRRWIDSNTYHDSLVVLRALEREPSDPAAADEVAAQVLWQIDWYHRFKYGWRHAHDGGLDSEDVLDVDQALAATPVLERTAAERDQLSERLDTMLRQGNLVPLDAPRLRTLEERAPGGLPRNDERRPEPVWDVAPNRFTGWATLDGLAYNRVVREAMAGRLVGTSYRRLADSAPTPAPTRGEDPSGAAELSPVDDSADRRAEPQPTAYRFKRARARARVPSLWTRLRTWVRTKLNFTASDLFWSLLLVLGASVAYLATIYNDTWGSPTDVLTAVGAGFGIAVGVQWAALPVFQSLRLKATDGAAGDGAPKEAAKR